MKKITALFVMLVMMFTMAACGDGSSSNTTTTGNGTNNSPTSENAEAIFNAAETAMAEVKDYTLKTTVKTSSALGEESTDVTVTTTTLVDIAGKKSLATTSVSDVNYVTYYDADVYMVDMGSEGAKLKAAMDAETLAALIASNSAASGLYFSDFANCTIEKSGSDYVLTVKGLNNAGALADLASGLTEDMVNAEIDLANFEMTIVVSNNQYKSITMKLAMSVNMDKVNMDPISSTYEVKLEYSDIGSTASKIVKPGEDGYVDTDLSLILGL